MSSFMHCNFINCTTVNCCCSLISCLFYVDDTTCPLWTIVVIKHRGKRKKGKERETWSFVHHTQNKNEKIDTLSTRHWRRLDTKGKDMKHCHTHRYVTLWSILANIRCLLPINCEWIRTKIRRMGTTLCHCYIGHTYTCIWTTGVLKLVRIVGIAMQQKIISHNEPIKVIHGAWEGEGIYATGCLSFRWAY